MLRKALFHSSLLSCEALVHQSLMHFLAGFHLSELSLEHQFEFGQGVLIAVVPSTPRAVLVMTESVGSWAGQRELGKTADIRLAAASLPLAEWERRDPGLGPREGSAATRLDEVAFGIFWMAGSSVVVSRGVELLEGTAGWYASKQDCSVILLQY